MIIYEGQQMPLGYGVVAPDMASMGVEVLPIPLNYLKRFWYILLCRDFRFVRSVGWINRLQETRIQAIQKTEQEMRQKNLVLDYQGLYGLLGRHWGFMFRMFKYRHLPDKAFQNKILKFVDDEWKRREKQQDVVGEFVNVKRGVNGK